jgi:hypothetical protein
MPRAGQVRVEPGRRLSDRVALGVLTATFPRRLVDEVIEATGRREQRNRLLTTPGAFYRQWRLVSIDATTIDVADTPANAGVFGRAGTGRGDGSAFPQVRVVALGECGTHAVIAAVMDSYAVVEQTLAKRLVTALQPGMLCLAERGFTAYPLFSSAAATGADLLWRAKNNAVLPVLERLPDGSFLSELVAAPDKYRREDVLPVRVVEYAIDDEGRPGATGTTYRLLTTILDPTQAPADELAALYAQRWEIESIFDELKTHQRGPRVILGSRTPEGVYQEAWGYLCVHYALRALIHDAADHGDLDPTGSASPKPCTPSPGAASGPV